MASDYTHRQKVELLADDLAKRAVNPRVGAPLLFRQLWALGIKVPPPLFIGFLPLTLLLALPMALYFGAIQWLLTRYLLPLPESTARSFTLKVGAAGGLVFGAGLAAYFRWKARRLRLPRWKDYPDAYAKKLLPTPPPRPLPGNAWLLGIAAFAALVLVLMGLGEADVLSLGRRPPASAVHDYFFSVVVGFALGLVCAGYIAHVLRSRQEFFVEFFAVRPWERTRRIRRWMFVYLLPILAAIEIFLIVCFWRELPSEPGMLAALLSLPLLARPWTKTRDLTQKRRAVQTSTPQEPSILEKSWSGEFTTRRYTERVVLWTALITALAFTGYTLMLPERENREQARAFVKEFVSHSLAEQERFYGLTDQARKGARTCDAARLASAEAPAKEVLRVYKNYTFDWNYGNAIHYGNLVLGRLALRGGDVDTARRYLLRAGLTTGSPQLGDYGPDMTLARELLERGQSRAVLKYFELCNRFWKNEQRNCISSWADEVKAGGIPDFGTRAGPQPQPERGWSCELIEGAEAPRGTQEGGGTESARQ